MRGVVLYGPPASGKDTVTAALHNLDQRYRQFPRLKCGPGRTVGYRMIDAHRLAALRDKGNIIYENTRYGAVYLIDRAHLMSMAKAGLVPVIHLGQPAGVHAVTAVRGFRWTIAELRCPRHLAAERISRRATGDVPERLAAYDATPPLADPDLLIDTSKVRPAEAAVRIHNA